MGTNRLVEPNNLIQKLEMKYSQCHSYSDHGMVEFDDPSNKRISIEFRSQFSRPDYLYFQWQDYGPRRGKTQHFSTLWSNQGKTIIRWFTNAVELEEPSSLNLAIAGATGCSAGAAHIVPTLLMSDLKADAKSLFQLTDPLSLANEVIDDQECYVIKGSLFKEHDHILWVSAQDLSLLRIRRDVSSSAEDSRKEHEAVMANKELLALLSERGIVPKEDMKHADTISFTEYNYRGVSFDEPITRMFQPTLEGD